MLMTISLILVLKLTDSKTTQASDCSSKSGLVALRDIAKQKVIVHSERVSSSSRFLPYAYARFLSSYIFLSVVLTSIKE